jgi:hypothetical protein
MRVMVIVKSNPESENGAVPSDAELSAMGKYNDELVKAGIMLAGDGLHPSNRGARIKFPQKLVVDGPFTESKELIAGYWIWQVRSMDEAVEWARRCPDPMPGQDAELEIRPVFESEDFGEAFTPELRERENELRDELARQKQS